MYKILTRNFIILFLLFLYMFNPGPPFIDYISMRRVSVLLKYLKSTNEKL